MLWIQWTLGKHFLPPAGSGSIFLAKSCQDAIITFDHPQKVLSYWRTQCSHQWILTVTHCNYRYQCLFPLPAPPPQGISWYYQVGLAQSLVSSMLFSVVLVCLRPCVCLPRVEFLPVLWISCWPSEPDSLDLLLLLPGPQAGEPDVGLRTLTPEWELLWYNY